MQSKRMLAFRFALTTALLLPLGSLPVAAQDIEKGKKTWRKCKSCHEVGEGAKNKTGPHLNDLIGRAAASVAGAKYSKGMQDAASAGLIWDDENLDTFLTKPKSLVKKTRMTFSGLKKPEDRANLIAFLKTFSSGDTEVDPPIKDPEVSAEILALVGDKDYGEYLSGTCTSCHQLSGSDDGIPSIVGWELSDFVTVLHAYKNKARENQVMQQVAGALNDEEIAGLAVYFNEQEAAE
jgi:cytochrome c